MKTLTMIARHGVKNGAKADISAYTLISPDYQTMQISAEELKKALAGNKVTITNLKLGPKGIESTNGSLSNYTFIDNTTGMVAGMPQVVILDRVERNNKLIGYTAFMQNGTIAEINVVDAVNLCNQKMIANGKIRHTQQGDIVSSIGGEYPLRKIEIKDAPKGEITVELLYFAATLGTNDGNGNAPIYAGAIISCTSAARMSGLLDAINKSNNSIVNKIAKAAGSNSVKEALAVKRMGANSAYGVVELSHVKDLAEKHGAKLKNKVGNIIISAVGYNKGETDEATITYDTSWKVIDKQAASSEKVTELVKYVSKTVQQSVGSKIEK